MLKEAAFAMAWQYSIEAAQYEWNGSCYCTPGKFYPAFPRTGQPVNATVVMDLRYE